MGTLIAFAPAVLVAAVWLVWQSVQAVRFERLPLPKMEAGEIIRNYEGDRLRLLYVARSYVDGRENAWVAVDDEGVEHRVNLHGVGWRHEEGPRVEVTRGP